MLFYAWDNEHDPCLEDVTPKVGLQVADASIITTWQSTLNDTLASKSTPTGRPNLLVPPLVSGVVQRYCKVVLVMRVHGIM